MSENIRRIIDDEGIAGKAVALLGNLKRAVISSVSPGGQELENSPMYVRKLSDEDFHFLEKNFPASIDTKNRPFLDAIEGIAGEILSMKMTPTIPYSGKLRNELEQRRLVKKGRSKTMESKHRDQYGQGTWAYDMIPKEIQGTLGKMGNVVDSVLGPTGNIVDITYQDRMSALWKRA